MLFNSKLFDSGIVQNMKISLVNVDLFISTKEILNEKLISCAVSNILKLAIVLTKLPFILLKAPDNFVLTVVEQNDAFLNQVDPLPP